MAELLLELFSEEIPARMQRQASDDLMRLVTEGLKAAGIEVKDVRAFATPRRLALVIADMPARSPDVHEERKGPRVGAPEQAIQGFLKGAGLKSIDDAEIVTDERKGDFYVARTSRKGRPAAQVVAEVIPDVIRKFPWPKSMRWGSGRLRWVRPLHSILCLLGGKVVRFEVEGIRSGDTTSGHRFMAPKRFAVKDFADYVKKLKAAKVILDPAERRRAILEGARAAAKAKRLELVEDEGLLAENAGLTEWPVPLMGAFDESFLDVPPEVLTTSMKAHQKCFSVRDPSSPSPLTGEGRGGAKRSAPPAVPPAPNPSPQGGGASLSNHFILVANLVAKDRGKAIIEGNGRVIRARLSDAKFFWDQDCRHTLESRLPTLNELIFHARLGTVHDKAHAIARLAMDLSEAVPGANRRHCEQAALLAKADLVSGMVGEFPELQGIMGRYYALNDKLPADVADAIAQHYSPLGPNDAVPAHPTAIVAAISDKLYSLVGFFGIDERPTGSRDPYALRRSALGIIRIVLENNLRLSLREWFGRTAEVYRDIGENVVRKHWTGAYDVNVELLTFFHDRLKVYLRDRGARHDLIDAVISPDADDLLMIVARVEALGKFLDTDDGATLLAGVRRATSILRIEEKKDAREYTGAPDGSLYARDEERALAAAIDVAKGEASEAVAWEDFAAAMRALAKLRAPVDAFFDHVTVNADDAALRENRLRLLGEIREATRAVADFSKIEG